MIRRNVKNSNDERPTSDLQDTFSSQGPETPAQSPQQSRPTVGGGDCLFHAIFGQETNGAYEDQEVVKHRRELADWIRSTEIVTSNADLLFRAIHHIMMGSENDLNDPIRSDGYPELTHLRHRLANREEIPLEKLLSVEVIAEYARMIETCGTYLSQNDAAIIAHRFDMAIEYQVTNLATQQIFSETLNENGQSGRVTIRFDGYNHYNRVAVAHSSGAITLQSIQPEPQPTTQQHVLSFSRQAQTLQSQRNSPQSTEMPLSPVYPCDIDQSCR